MRKLSDNFMQALLHGQLNPLRQKAIADPDLALEIRDNYINIYFKGKSLLKLTETRSGKYQVYLHPKYTLGLDLPAELDIVTLPDFLHAIPRIKENILINSHPSIEIEYEQLIIRANNCEPRNNSEYFIVDRQITAGEAGRFDLTGFYWPRNARRRGQTVSPCLFEIKAALNPDIEDVHEQLARYYTATCEHASEIAATTECILRQKLALGLYQQSADRLAAMRTLNILTDIEQFIFILVLVDYNPYSHRFDRTKLAALPFARQIKIFYGGFGMWEQSVKPITAS